MVNYLAMLSIKLVRTGKKNLPSFRIVVGLGNKVVENLGYYYPLSNPPLLKLIKERIEYWRKSGARLNPAVAAMLKGKYEFRRYVPKSGEESPVETPPPAESNASEPVKEEKAPENA